jgi:hypothetical protein
MLKSSATIRRADKDTRRVRAAMPGWMAKQLGRKALMFGVTRQSLIKMWIAEKLQ